MKFNIPLAWKIIRELRRLVRKLQYIPEFFTDPINRIRYDARRDKDVKVYQGVFELQKCVAVYALWQPSGILNSSFETCRFLMSKGFSVIVVCNAPLSDSDRLRFLSLSSLVIERPNWGYDFGAYQEGIRITSERIGFCDELLLVNDSVWFPLFTETDIIERFRACDADVVSPICYRHRSNPERDYLQSYLLYVRRSAIRSLVFINFWRSYRASSNKEKTVHRGEKGFSRRMRSANFRLDAIYCWSDLVRTIQELSEEDLDSVLNHELTFNSKGFGRRLSWSEQHLKNFDHLRDQMLGLSSNREWSGYLLRAHPLLTNLSSMRIPFLKKDRSLPYVMVRRQFVHYQSKGFVQTCAKVFNEILHWDS